MSREAPWFKFFAARWIADRDIRYMTPEQRGYLIQLWCEAWESDPAGTLPEAPEILWKLAGALTRKQFEKVSGPVLAKFELHEGRYFYAELIEQHEGLAAMHESRTRAATVGAQARWSKRKGMRNALPNTLSNAEQSNNNRTAYQSRTEKQEERSESSIPGTKKWEIEQKWIAWNQDQDKIMGRRRN